MPVCLSLHLVGHLKNKSSACCSAKDKMIFTRRCTSGARCHAWPERNLSLERGGDGGGDVTHRCIQPKNIHLAVTAAPPATSSSSQLQHQQQQAPKLWLFFYYCWLQCTDIVVIIIHFSEIGRVCVCASVRICVITF